MRGGAVDIRTAGAADATLVRELIAASPDAPRWPGAAWDVFLAGDKTTGAVRRRLWVASEPTGALGGLIAVSLLDETTELELLLVHPDCRRRGVGRMLSEAWLRWAADDGAAGALLEVRASNQPARRLYEQLGFVVEGTRGGYYTGPTEDAVLMRKSLLE